MTTVHVPNPLVSSVSAFFPCYNDALSIGKMVRDVRESLVEAVSDFEIIVVNDGSSDNSLQVLQELQREFSELRIVNHEVNRGYGGALLSGFAASTKQWVFYTDGDAQYDAHEITRLISAVTETSDVIQGFKIGRGDPLHRRVIGRVYHHGVRFFFRLPIRDTDCDFRLIRNSVLSKVRLRSTTGVICVEMMHALNRVDARFIEVGVSHYHRPHGKSQFFRVPAISRSALQILQLWTRLMLRRSYD
jgi:glycosyltransferase involved in cell wall biosynthesis